ncbi:MAG: hypothetical protein QGG49_00610 [Dehalococcoidales bacterium]|jgi:hypothetical protein|nr:hypothetical protein [Dehalococcoidales bacterium]MDP6576467.1 hypothetical protein [Dehalococcoidales bacterium]
MVGHGHFHQVYLRLVPNIVRPGMRIKHDCAQNFLPAAHCLPDGFTEVSRKKLYFTDFVDDDSITLPDGPVQETPT